MKKKYIVCVVLALVVALIAGHWLPRAEAVAADSASVTGVVKFQGAVLPPTKIDMSSDPNCTKAHASPGTTEDVVAGENGVLESAVVYVSGGLEGRTFTPPAEPFHVAVEGKDSHGLTFRRVHAPLFEAKP